MENEDQMTENTELPAPAKCDASPSVQPIETAGLPGQNGFVPPNPEIPVYIHYGPFPGILPATFQWKGPSRIKRRSKKKPARPHYN